MGINCPNCGKTQSKSKITKTNEERFNEYENKLKDSIEKSIQEELREGFKRKLEKIDNKYKTLDSVTNLRLELSQLTKDIRLLNDQKDFKKEHSRNLYYKISSLKHSLEYLSMTMNNSFNFEDKVKKLINSIYDDPHNIFEESSKSWSKKLNDATTKGILLEKKAHEIENEIEPYRQIFYRQEEAVKKLRYEVSRLRNAIHEISKKQKET